MLGLASKTGTILNVYKKYLRDSIDLAANRAILTEELGDELWYIAAVATACGLDLNSIAEANLLRTRDRYHGEITVEDLSGLPSFDSEYPMTERFPRKLVLSFIEADGSSGVRQARMVVVSAEPNAFPDGRVTSSDGKVLGFQVGGGLGDPLTDNSRQPDNYRYHDAIHLGFMAVLGWSPNTRSLLKLKRKSDQATDECEDGARAVFAEEGLAAVLSRLAKRRLGFLTELSVDGEVIEVAKAAVTDLEVDAMPSWLWRRAISQGFSALKQLADNEGGYLTADLDARTLTYAKMPT
ncbi:hypothetical protein [Kribbella koreensis]